MKVLTLFLLIISLNVSAQPRLCEVYGISDSPQHLNCRLGTKELKLTCDTATGVYQLGDEVVEVAYHEEVEDGPVPLMFKTADAKLKVLIYSNKKIDAEFSQKNRISRGSCQI